MNSPSKSNAGWRRQRRLRDLDADAAAGIVEATGVGPRRIADRAVAGREHHGAAILLGVEAASGDQIADQRVAIKPRNLGGAPVR